MFYMPGIHSCSCSRTHTQTQLLVRPWTCVFWISRGFVKRFPHSLQASLSFYSSLKESCFHIPFIRYSVCFSCSQPGDLSHNSFYFCDHDCFDRVAPMLHRPHCTKEAEEIGEHPRERSDQRPGDQHQDGHDDGEETLGRAEWREGELRWWSQAGHTRREVRQCDREQSGEPVLY